jgi:hypothetical protein
MLIAFDSEVRPSKYRHGEPSAVGSLRALCLLWVPCPTARWLAISPTLPHLVFAKGRLADRHGVVGRYEGATDNG